MDNGDYIFYADESGDHSLVSIDAGYPMFVLSICGFRIQDYCQRIVPSFQKFKFDKFGHDMVILHEREIRMQTGDFDILNDREKREDFLGELTRLVAETKFKIFCVAINKLAFRSDLFPDNPYVISLRFCVENIFMFLMEAGLLKRRYFFVFEKRGKKEDKDLELEFRRIVDGENSFNRPFDGFQIRFADKKSNSTGMQIADLCSRPIGLKRIRPDQSNRSFDAIEAKILPYKFSKRLQNGVWGGA